MSPGITESFLEKGALGLLAFIMLLIAVRLYLDREKDRREHAVALDKKDERILQIAVEQAKDRAETMSVLKAFTERAR